ncbi:hypothetical protein L2E82_37469 [Cichorium intybus]|uniref:Uncharacterized protein n=1 Tax=Cichorium intybus TaxID=13427 RepID=A0ACB9ADU0_CICIN|nr:hypothetical protein L2E82_37469 [Cichorium intybus]
METISPIRSSTLTTTNYAFNDYLGCQNQLFDAHHRRSTICAINAAGFAENREIMVGDRSEYTCYEKKLRESRIPNFRGL